MNLAALPRMVVSANAVWPELEALHVPLSRFLLLVILPLAFLPPVMIYYAGTHYGDAFVLGFASKPWAAIAAVFFLTEVASVILMGWLIKQVAKSHNLYVSSHDAFMLASIAPIPMWLSALCLLLPMLAVDVAIALLGLAAGCGLLHHGVLALAHTREEVSAAGITQTVMGAGIICWALLLTLIVAL